MRKLFFVLCAAMLLGAAGIQSADAAAGTRHRFNGTTAFTFGTPCSFVHQTYDATISSTRNQFLGSFHLDGCVSFGPNGPDTFLYDGTAGLDSQGHPSHTGTVSGTITPSDANPCPIGYDNAATIDFTMVLGGTPAQHIIGIWCSNGTDSGGPIFGKMTG